VGLYSTRTPHRHNPVGLSVCRLDAVSKNTLTISGVDFVHGTPVIDVKPYVPYDSVPGAVVPAWVRMPSDGPRCVVEVAQRAREQVAEAVARKGLALYSKAEDILDAITQVLSLEIRSLYQQSSAPPAREFTLRLDRLTVVYTVAAAAAPDGPLRVTVHSATCEDSRAGR
jgi:hypothetical protein